jgi:hypothetical protein
VTARAAVRLASAAVLLAAACATSRSPRDFLLSHRDYHYKTLSEYHDLSLWESDPKIMFDDTGTLSYAYGGAIGRQVNPVTASQYALVCYDLHQRTGETVYRDKFLRQVASLERYAIPVGEAVHFRYAFDLDRYELKKPWISGLAQAQAASVFLRAYALSGEQRYVELARRSLVPTTIPSTEGGVAARTPEGYDWVEEYPSQPPSLVLNGFVYAIIGALEYQKIDPAYAHAALTARWIDALKHSLQHYEQDQWLLYDRYLPRKVSANYMGHQILQMYQLYDLTHDRWFLETARRWEKDFDWARFFTGTKATPRPLTHRVAE